MLTWFLMTKIIILYQRGAPDIGTEKSKIDLAEFGPQQLDHDDGGVLFFFGLQNQFTGEGYTLDYVSQFIQLAVTVKSSNLEAEKVLVPMRVCNREDFEKVDSGMFYDMQVMSLGSMEALACADLSETKLMGNLMMPMYEIVQLIMTDCDGDGCGDPGEKEAFL